MTRRRAERQRSKWVFWACLPLILIAPGCGQRTPTDTRAADESAIRDLDAQWSKTAGAKDVDGAVSFYSDDASLLPPNAPLVTGRPAIRAVWASLLSSEGSLSWQADRAEVSRSGDLAYVMGAYQVTSQDPQGKPIAEHGKFVEVWKKQADGKWKTVADIFNSDLPMPAPSPEKKKGHHRQSRKKRHANARSSALN